MNGAEIRFIKVAKFLKEIVSVCEMKGRSFNTAELAGRIRDAMKGGAK